MLKDTKIRKYLCIIMSSFGLKKGQVSDDF